MDLATPLGPQSRAFCPKQGPPPANAQLATASIVMLLAADHGRLMERISCGQHPRGAPAGVATPAAGRSGRAGGARSRWRRPPSATPIRHALSQASSSQAAMSAAGVCARGRALPEVVGSGDAGQPSTLRPKLGGTRAKYLARPARVQPARVQDVEPDVWDRRALVASTERKRSAKARRRSGGR